MTSRSQGGTIVKALLRLSLGVSLFCAVGGATALVAGLARTEAPLPLRFDPDPFVLPAETKVGDAYDIQVGVVNGANEAAHILGVREFCAQVCFYRRGLPVTIPPGGRGLISLNLYAGSPGPVSEQVEFFTDRPTQPILTLRVVGEVREAVPDEDSVQSSKP